MNIPTQRISARRETRITREGPTEIGHAGHRGAQLGQEEDVREREEERGLGQRPAADVRAHRDPDHRRGEHVVGEEERERERLDAEAALRVRV